MWSLFRSKSQTGAPGCAHQLEVYERALRYALESFRDRRTLRDVLGPNAHLTLPGEIAAFNDMGRVALAALREFHPDEPSPFGSAGKVG